MKTISDLPKFKVKQGGRELPYFKEIIRTKERKYIKIDNPRFSGLKCQLSEMYSNQQFWDICNDMSPNTGSDFQKRIAIVQIGRRVKKYPILKWQIINKWPFIVRRFTLEQLQVLEKATNSKFDLKKPISLDNRPPSISVPGFQVNHEPQNGRMRLVSVKEHDGISKNPHAGGMRLNNPEGFSQKHFEDGDFERYKIQNIKNPLSRLCFGIYNNCNYAIASIVKFYKLVLFLLIVVLIILFIMLLVKKCKLPEVKQDTPQEPTVTIMSKDLPAHAHQHYVSFAVLFEFDSDYVETFGENINSCIAICKSDSTLKMIIHGYTCDIGSEEYNHNLSKRRAENTKNLILTRYPFMHDRIEIIGWGENFPDSLKIANRAQNRRVDIELIQYE